MEISDIIGDFLQTDDTSRRTHLKCDGMMEELLACIDTYIYTEITPPQMRKVEINI